MTNQSTEVRFNVSQKQETRGKTETILTRFDVERAWQDQAKAVDRWEWLVMHNQPEDVCEQAWEDMQDATQHAQELDRIFADQYRRREWLSSGRWNVRAVA